MLRGLLGHSLVTSLSTQADHHHRIVVRTLCLFGEEHERMAWIVTAMRLI